MSRYRDQVKSAIEAIRFHSPTSYSWFGALSPRLNPAVKRVLSAAA